MDYLDDEARNGYVAIIVIASVILTFGLVLSSMVNYTPEPFYDEATYVVTETQR